MQIILSIPAARLQAINATEAIEGSLQRSIIQTASTALLKLSGSNDLTLPSIAHKQSNRVYYPWGLNPVAANLLFSIIFFSYCVAQRVLLQFKTMLAKAKTVTAT